MKRHIGIACALVLAALFVASIASLAQSRWTRTHLLPSSLRYIPPEANALIAVGTVGSVWDGMDFHFGRVIREGTSQVASGEQESQLAEWLADLGQGRGVARQADLVCRHGIDIERGVLAGLALGEKLDGMADAAQMVVVLPVANDARLLAKYCSPRTSQASDAQPPEPSCSAPPAPSPSRTASEDKLVRFLCTGSAKAVEATAYPCDASRLRAGPGAGSSWVVADHIYQLDSDWLVFPQPDTAVLASSCELLDRSLGEQDRNLSYARGDDALFEAARYQLRRPLLSGPGALLYVRSLPPDLVPAGVLTVTLNLVPDAVLGDLRVRTSRLNARIADQILATAQGEQPWRIFSRADDAAALVLQDAALPRYLDSASSSPDIARSMRKFLGGILVSASRLKTLQQIVALGIEYREGVPQVVLGIWGKEDELKQFVLDTQRKLRQARDKAVAEGGGPAPQGESVQAADFSGGDYVQTYGSLQIRYLEPAITADDLTYRFSDIKPEERNILLENRDRLASTITGDVLWVSAGAKPLMRVIESRGANARANEFEPGARSDADLDKLRVLASMASLIRQGLLSGESDVETVANELLLDFRYHREVVLTLKPADGQQEIIVQFAAQGRVAGGPAGVTQGSGDP